MAVAEFLRKSRRRTNRATINPLDKSTLISIYPRDIHEIKVTIQPSNYDIPAGTYENPSLVVIGSASWWRELDPEQPLLEIPIPSVVIADSVVKDYCSGLIGCNMGDKMPGISFLPGELTLDKIRKDYPGFLEALQKKQKAWYQELIKMADVLWSRSNGNPLAITDDMKLAAREFKIDKAWIKDFQHASLVPCVACGNMRNPAFPVCPVCKAIADPEAAKSLGIKFAS